MCKPHTKRDEEIKKQSFKKTEKNKDNKNKAHGGRMREVERVQISIDPENIPFIALSGL